MSVENRSQSGSVPHPWSEFPTFRQYPGKNLSEDGLEIISKNEILFLAEVWIWAMRNPGKLLIMQQVAKGIGISGERASQLYSELKSEHELPPKQSQSLIRQRGLLLRQQAQLLRRVTAEKKTENLDKVRTLRLKGKGNKEISRETGLSPNQVLVLLKEILPVDPSLRLRSRRPKEERDIFDRLVNYCRDVLLLSNNQTAQYLGTSEGLVKHSRRRELSKREMKRKKV